MNNIVFKLAIVLIASLGVITSHSAFATKEAPLKMGTWENKDEDGDGIPDEQDDYPFDASKSELFLIQESEQNNLVETADDSQGHFPIRIKGVLPHSGDTDVFKLRFPTALIKPHDRLSITILSSDDNFYPTANLFDKNGTQLVTYREDNIKPVNGVKYHFTYTPNGNDVGYLSVSSLRQVGDASYIAEISVDNDADGMDDIKEMALGINPHTADTDKDGIKDSYEYHVYQHGQLKTDFDNDGIPNFLDDDSDGDGLPDRLESFADIDKDSLGNFVDTDSDGNDISDAVEAVNVNHPIDSDRDSTPDYRDLDDDLDGIFDSYDSHRLVAVEPPESFKANIKLYGVTTKLSEQVQLSQQSLQGQTISLSGRYNKNTEYIAALWIGNQLFNEKIISDDNGKLYLTIPRLNDIQTSSIRSSVFIYSDADERTNSSNFELLSPHIPIITEFENKSYARGETIVLKGRNFNSNTTAWFGDINVKSSHFAKSTQIEFKVPENISEFSIRLQNGYGKGNSERLMVKNEFTVKLSVPKAISSQYEHLFYHDADGNIKEFDTTKPTTVNLPALSDPLFILSVKKNEEYARVFALQIEGQGVQTVSFESTLFVWLYRGVPGLTMKSMQQNSLYPELYDYLHQKLSEDIYFFSYENSAAQNEFFEKLRQFANSVPRKSRFSHQ
ncbi:IPT/TIG domain-containing protein [Shewanella donghaensis]|uniref:IPT/TIG domain-containing protein n=1 Tax=Shewanella donghaensis TaxID=238836 RepID=UPI001181DE90|nr:IPT/TIG domain-containing protein [Shewanella donghaensis]